MNRIAGLLAFGLLAGFLGILAYSVPSPDLIAVIALTLCLAGFDTLKSYLGSNQ